MAKPLKFHQTLNQAPRSAKDNGRHRRADPQVHSGASRKSGGADKGAYPGFTFLSWTEPPPVRTIENAGIRAGEIIAYRGWRVEGETLRSVYKRDHVWEPHVPMTGDVRGEYGVHAFKEAAHLRTYIASYQLHDMTAHYLTRALYWGTEEPEGKVKMSVYAIGQVALWGEVIEHDRGYRAEFAKIIKIERLSGDPSEERLQLLRSKYEPPLSLTSAK